MQAVDLRRHRNQKVVAVVKELLALAEDGDLQGLTFVVKLGPHDHRAGTVGDHQRNPAEAVMAALRLNLTLLEVG